MTDTTGDEQVAGSPLAAAATKSAADPLPSPTRGGRANRAQPATGDDARLTAKNLRLVKATVRDEISIVGARLPADKVNLIKRNLETAEMQEVLTREALLQAKISLSSSAMFRRFIDALRVAVQMASRAGEYISADDLFEIFDDAMHTNIESCGSVTSLGLSESDVILLKNVLMPTVDGLRYFEFLLDSVAKCRGGFKCSHLSPNVNGYDVDVAALGDPVKSADLEFALAARCPRDKERWEMELGSLNWAKRCEAGLAPNYVNYNNRNGPQHFRPLIDTQLPAEWSSLPSFYTGMNAAGMQSESSVDIGDEDVVEIFPPPDKVLLFKEPKRRVRVGPGVSVDLVEGAEDPSRLRPFSLRTAFPERTENDLWGLAPLSVASTPSAGQSPLESAEVASHLNEPPVGVDLKSWSQQLLGISPFSSNLLHNYVEIPKAQREVIELSDDD